MCDSLVVSSAAVNIRGLAALSSAGLEALLALLPAEEQAQIKWAAGASRAVLIRLYEAEPTRDCLVDVSTALMIKGRTLQERIEALMGNREALAIDSNDFIRSELQALRAYVEPDAASAAEWVWYGAWQPFHAWVNACCTADEAIEALREACDVEETELRRALAAPEGGLMRALCLLLAAFEGPARHLDTARATELAYLAFDHACEGVDAFAAHGIALADYVVQTAEDRVKRTIRSADALRAVLTDGDLEALRAARLGSLR